MPKISVLMPAYNVEKYIAESIESILNQTFTDFEFLIINDGSTDGTAQIIKEYAKKDKRIRFIDNKKNQGLIAVLNQGLDLCTGEYIARMDSDDISLPERFAKQVEYMEMHPECGLLGTAGQNFGADTNTYYSPEHVDMFDLLRGVGFYHPSVMMRKSVMDKYNLRYDPRYYLVEDLELWSRMLHVTQECNLPEVLIKYRVHASSVSVANRDLQAANKRIVRKQILDCISDNLEVRSYLLRMSGDPQYETKKVYWVWLFKLIPILRIMSKCGQHYTKTWLFGFLPLIKVKNDNLYLFHLFKIAKIRECRKHFDISRFTAFNLDDTQVLESVRSLPKGFTYIPNSGNMGDMLIAYATLMFFDNNHIKYTMYDGSMADNVCYGGGGQWTADYKQHWLKWLDVFKQAKKIVILPSSFNNCPELIAMFDERFTVFCREKQSYDYLMAAKTKAKIILDHDMALRLDNRALKKFVKARSWDDRQTISKVLNALPFTRHIVKFNRLDCESAGHYDTDLDLSAVRYGNSKASRRHIEFCAKLMLAVVDCADAVITDRLHVGIAAALMGKEVYLLDNTYGKLSNVYKHSLNQNPRIHFCQEMPTEKQINASKTAYTNFEKLRDL